MVLKIHLFLFFYFLALLNLVTLNSFVLYSIMSLFFIRHIYKKIEYKKQFQILSAEFQHNVVYSPVNGVVKNLKQSEFENEIVIRHELFQGADLCLPMDGEINKVKIDYHNYGNYDQIKENNGTLSFNLLNTDREIRLDVYSRFLPIRLSPIISDGDRGKIGAIFWPDALAWSRENSFEGKK